MCFATLCWYFTIWTSFANGCALCMMASSLFFFFFFFFYFARLCKSPTCESFSELVSPGTTGYVKGTDWYPAKEEVIS